MIIKCHQSLTLLFLDNWNLRKFNYVQYINLKCISWAHVYYKRFAQGDQAVVVNRK